MGSKTLKCINSYHDIVWWHCFGSHRRRCGRVQVRVQVMDKAQARLSLVSFVNDDALNCLLNCLLNGKENGSESGCEKE